MFEIKSQNESFGVSLVSEVQVIPNCFCMSGSQKVEFFLLCCNNVGDFCHPEKRVKENKTKQENSPKCNSSQQAQWVILSNWVMIPLQIIIFHFYS